MILLLSPLWAVFVIPDQVHVRVFQEACYNRRNYKMQEHLNAAKIDLIRAS